ncbi:MAG: hypothetical protein IKZ82_13235 [Clostridia bacterium]|nr:hypothetical protein [Clostridia bacterium]
MNKGKTNNKQKERAERLDIRLSVSEKAAVQRKAKACGLSISEYVRKRALGYEPRAAPSDELLAFTSALIELANKNEASAVVKKTALELLADIRRYFFESGAG